MTDQIAATVDELQRLIARLNTHDRRLLASFLALLASEELYQATLQEASTRSPLLLAATSRGASS